MAEDPIEHPPALLDPEGGLSGWPSDPELDPYGSRMVPRFGLPLRIMARLFFGRIDDEENELVLADVLDRGLEIGGHDRAGAAG